MVRGYRPDIDGLRALAIAAVVLCHAHVPGFAGGYVGVDMFFVISGFLITRLIRGDEAFGYVRFYERRARRLLPALLVMLVAATIAAWLILLPREMEFYSRELAATGLLVPNIFAWQSSGYFGPQALDLPLLHLWSLGVEEQFYLVFPLAIRLLDRYLPPRMLPWVVGAIALVSLGLAELLVRRPSSAAFYLLPPRAWELSIGCLLAILDTRPPARRIATIAAVAGLALIVLAVTTYDDGTSFPGLAALPPVLGAALLIWAGGVPDNAGSRVLAARPLVALGLISYSLYLWHWPLLSLFQLWTDSTPTVPQALALLALAIPISIASWRWVERPLRERRFAMPPARRLIVALAALLPVAAGGIVLTLAHGFPGRVDARVLQVNDDAQPASTMLPPCRTGVVAAQPALCGYPATAAKRGTVLIWGDSHAGHFVASIASQLTPLGYAVVLAESRSCPPLVGIPLGILAAGGSIGSKCMAFNAAMPARLASVPDLQLVVLAARWTSFVPNLAGQGSTDRWLDNADGSRADGVQSRRLLAAGLRAAAGGAAATGAHVMLIDQSPTFERPPRNCVARSRRDGLPTAGCDRPENISADVRRDVARIIDATAVAVGGVAYHPARVLCGPHRCSPVRGGHLLYRDAHHLGREGARFYAPLLRAPLLAALTRQAGHTAPASDHK